MPIQTTQTLLTQREAAETLGVSERRITMLREQGELSWVPRGRNGVLITEESVRRYAHWGGQAGRPYSMAMAFGALYMLSGEKTPWLSAQQRYRLRGYLRDLSAEDVVRLCRRRATVIELWGRETKLAEVAARVRPSAGTGDLAHAFQLMPSAVIEGYVGRDDAEHLIEDCRLRRGGTPVRVRLRVTDMGSLFSPAVAGTPMPMGVCAADLAESLNPRERCAGLEWLSSRLGEWKEGVI